MFSTLTLKMLKTSYKKRIHDIMVSHLPIPLEICQRIVCKLIRIEVILSWISTTYLHYSTFTTQNQSWKSVGGVKNYSPISYEDA